MLCGLWVLRMRSEASASRRGSRESGRSFADDELPSMVHEMLWSIWCGVWYGRAVSVLHGDASLVVLAIVHLPNTDIQAQFRAAVAVMGQIEWCWVALCLIVAADTG